MICEQCGEEIEDGEEYAEIQSTGCTLHIDCEDDYWDEMKSAETIYRTRSIKDEKWSYEEDMIDYVEV